MLEERLQLRGIFTCIYQFDIKEGDKGHTEEQADKEVHRLRFGRVLNGGASVPTGMWMCPTTWILSGSRAIQISCRPPDIGMVNDEPVSSPAPLSGECRVGLEVPRFSS